jgi:hypothetical protein
MVPEVDPRWLAGKKELAETFHVPRETLGSWTERPSTGCPAPVAHLSMGPIWNASEVIKWYVNWKPRKGPKGIKLGYVEPAILEELGLENGAGNGKAKD